MPGESFPVSLAKTLESKVTGAAQPAGIYPGGVLKKSRCVSRLKNRQFAGLYRYRRAIPGKYCAEIMANALSAGLRDPRFHPVRQEELDDLVYSVDVLQPPEPVASIEDLDPVKYGVIVRAGSRSGLLLPNLEGIDTAEEQVAIARQKAGIGPEEEVQLSRFEVVRYE